MERLSDSPFPPYTYVPGKQPHPVREVEGHSYGQPEPHVAEFEPTRWRECSAYLFGIDLFNAKFYWESHEQWEAVWHCVGRSGEVADLLKGLIKLSAAGVKLLEGKPIGVDRHGRRALELFDNVSQSSEQLCGMKLSDLKDHANQVIAMDAASAQQLPFQLRIVE